MTRESTSPSVRSPIVGVTAVLVMTWVVLAGLGWSSYRFHHGAKEATQRCVRIEELRGRIIYLDEVLTMSARMAAFTGETKWEERYRRFEPLLDAAIKEAIALAPGALGATAAGETDAANVKLVEMENRVFGLIRQGSVDEAKALLFSAEYDLQKEVYSKGMDGFAMSLAAASSTAVKRDQQLSFLYTGAMLLLVPLSICGWLVVIRAVSKWRATLTRQAEELAMANETLDQNVAKRTQALQDEIGERKRIEDKLREKVGQLARFNRLTHGREARIIEMKREVNEMARMAGVDPPYESFDQQRRGEGGKSESLGLEETR